MSDEVLTPHEETAGVETAVEPDLSLSEHEEQFNSGPKPIEEAPLATEAEIQAAEHHSQQQRREKETGKFTEGKRRKENPAKRIGELTGRAKTAEERLAAAEARIAELSTPPAQTTHGNGHAPAPSQAQTTPAAPQTAGERFVLPAPPFDPQPVETDPKFGGDFTKYLADVSGWNGRQAVRQMEFDRYVAQQQQQVKDAEQQIVKDFASRVELAKAKYEDFEDVAFGPTPIKKDSLPDIFLTRDDNGVEMLYYLHRSEHRQELDALLKMSEFQQVKFLAALSQRLASTGAGSTGTTTSVSSPRTIVIPPKPPNVVRTEAQQARGGPPSDRELSLSEHEHYFATGKRR